MFILLNLNVNLCVVQEKEQQYENEIPKEEQVIAGETSKETGLATIKTIETLKSVCNFFN